jgi:hypothetical protein
MNFCFHLYFRQRGQRERSKSVCRSKQVHHPAALHLCSQKDFQHVRGQQTLDFCFTHQRGR